MENTWAGVCDFFFAGPKIRWTARKKKGFPMYIQILLGICGQSLKAGMSGCFLRIPDVSQMLKMREEEGRNPTAWK